MATNTKSASFVLQTYIRYTLFVCRLFSSFMRLILFFLSVFVKFSVIVIDNFNVDYAVRCFIYNYRLSISSFTQSWIMSVT